MAQQQVTKSMPDKFWLLLGGKTALAATLPIAPLLVPALAAEAVIVQHAVGGDWGERELWAWCLVGSSLGSLVGLSIWPPKRQVTFHHAVRRVTAKYVCSFAAGAAFSPMLIDYLAVAPEPQWIVGISGAVSALGLGLLHVAMPTIVEVVPGIVRSFGAAARAAIRALGGKGDS